MVRVNSASKVIAVPKELVPSGQIELEPVPGGRFEGEVPDHVGKFLEGISRGPAEYTITPVEKEKPAETHAAASHTAPVSHEAHKAEPEPAKKK